MFIKIYPKGGELREVKFIFRGGDGKLNINSLLKKRGQRKPKTLLA